ncbi:Uncharacterised protein [Vibrio cholerae]|nr:Uncharacterised protein [Vibrio cholerae]
MPSKPPLLITKIWSPAWASLAIIATNSSILALTCAGC